MVSRCWSLAIIVERDALHQFHDEKRGAVVGGARVEQPGDVRGVHERDGLPLCLEAGENCFRLPAFGANKLDGNLAFDRFGLVGHPNGAHAAFADFLEQLVPPGDDRPFGFHGRGRTIRPRGRRIAFRLRFVGAGRVIGSGMGRVQRRMRRRVGRQQGFHPRPQRRVWAFAIEKRRPLVRW